MKIWVNEQRDPSGMLYACIACCDETQAKECYEAFEENLTEDQRAQGWLNTMRTVSSWDEVPVSSLKLS